MERVERFTQDGCDFLYIDFSGIRSNSTYVKVIAITREAVIGCQDESLCMIINVAGTTFDSDTKEIFVRWVKSGTRYVKRAAVVGSDNIKKIFINSILAAAGATDPLLFFSNKEKAISALSING